MDNLDAPPRVTALIPSYSAAQWIKRAIDSLRTQTFGAMEIVVVDDGSTDGTAAIVERIAASDPRVRLAIRPHEGISATANHGLHLARGEYVARLDADDIALPDRLARQVAFLDAHPEVGVVGGQMVWIDADERKRGRQGHPLGDLQTEVLKYSPLGSPSTMFRRDLVLGLGGFRSALDTAEDYDLWLRISEVALLANLPDVVTYYRSHPDQVTRRSARRQKACAIVAQGLAVLRRRGKADPLIADFRLTPENIDQLGLDSERTALASESLRSAQP